MDFVSRLAMLLQIVEIFDHVFLTVHHAGEEWLMLEAVLLWQVLSKDKAASAVIGYFR